MAVVKGSRHTDSSLNHISLEYSYTELQQATRNFDASSKLGHGSFGGVFRGVQRDGTDVAIKVLDMPEEGGFEEEVRVLSKFRHPNLVILMGFARHGTQRFLVYELLAGGDVFRRLQKSCVENASFPWRARVSTAFDAACGLSHLHHATPKVFHRDIKSPNILLDRNGGAKMADFGLACLSHAREHKVQQASGTVGYACPHYVKRGIVTEGSEVYSFGIVVLELLTAMPPAYLAPMPDGSQQYKFLISHIGGDNRVAASLADAKAQWNPQASHGLADLAMRCTQNVEELRPNFADVVNALRTLRDLPDAPQPHSVLPAPQVGATVGQTATPVNKPPCLQQPLLNCQAAANARPATPMGGHQLPGVTGAARMRDASGMQQQPQPQQLQQQPHLMPLAVGSPMAARHAPLARKPSFMPLLWTLECVRSDGTNLSGLSKEQRSLVHRQEPGGPLLATLRVGRLFQDEFFRTIVRDEDALGAVSREHFQIWADELQTEAPAPGAVPCTFHFTNFSAHGTIVNGNFLRERGEQVPLHSGDSIELARPVGDGAGPMAFMEFCFDLKGSILRDADLFGSEETRSRAGVPQRPQQVQPKRVDPPKVAVQAAVSKQVPLPNHNINSSSVHTAVVPSRQQSSALPDAAASTVSAEGSIEFVGEAFFALEVGGTALRDGATAAQRRIVHGPRAVGEACLPLVLGRSPQWNFWQRLLIDEAFQGLSRQHLQIEASEVALSGADSLVFHVRNLSERSPIRVTSSMEDNNSNDGARPLEKDQRRLLHHGDLITINPNRGRTLWLVFRDLTLAGGRKA